MHAWLHRQPSFRRPQPGKRQPAGLVGRPDRAGQGDRHEQAVRRRLEHAWLVLLARPMPPASTRRPTIRDIVAAQKALLDQLGVRHLVAVAGPSYGGYQAFQWAVAYPDFIDA